MLYLPTLSSALTLAADSPQRLILAPAASAGIRIARPASAVTIAVGPEGDWNAAELEHATQLGYAQVRFGPRILRTETAGVAAIAALQGAAGDLDVRAGWPSTEPQSSNRGKT